MEVFLSYEAHTFSLSQKKITSDLTVSNAFEKDEGTI